MATPPLSTLNTTVVDHDIREYTGYTLVNVSITAIILTSVVIALRFWAKTYGGVKFGFDDGLIVTAYIFNLGLCAIGILMVNIAGVGDHTSALQITPAVMTAWYKLIFAFELVYFVSVTLPKLAILWLYLRIFNWKGPMRVSTLCLFGAVVATGSCLFFAACFQCVPIAYWWDRSIPGGRCFEVQAFFDAQSVPGFVLDMFIMVLPLRTIWGLRLPTAKRVALLFIFLVASCGVIASVVRAGSFFKHPALEDATFNGVPLSRYSIAESSCYIIANCLAHLRPLISRFASARIKAMFYKAVDVATRRGSASNPQRASTPAAGVVDSMKDDGFELTPWCITHPHHHRFETGREGRDETDIKPSTGGKDETPGLSTMSERNTTTTSASIIFQGQNVVSPPYTHEIAGGQQHGDGWEGQPACIKVTTEVSLHSDCGRPDTFP